MADEVIDFKELQKKLKPKTILVIVVVLFILFAGFSSFYMVDQTEEAVVLLFGKYSRKAGPGLHFKLPFGIEKNYNVRIKKVFKEEFGFRTEKAGVTTRYSTRDFTSESIMLTGDLNILEVTWIIQYRIVDPKAWLFVVEDRDKTIRDISQAVINQLVGDRAIFDVIGAERRQIEQLGQEMMNEYFKLYNLGVSVRTVQVKNPYPPKGPVYDAFEDVNKATKDRDRLINEGKEAYNRAIPKARGVALKTIQEAEGYATEKVNKAKGDVARFLAVYSEYVKNPKITRIRLYYEMFEDVFKNIDSVELIDKKLKNFIPFKSLDKESGGGKK